MKYHLTITRFALLALSLLGGRPAQGQQDVFVKKGDLPRISIMEGNTVHFLSPEPVQYVDISSDRILGDLPLKNLVRIKLLPDSTQNGFSTDNLGPLTIVGDNYLVQYNLEEWTGGFLSDIPTLVEISYDTVTPLEVPGIGLSQSQMKAHALGLLAGRKAGTVRKQTDYGITVSLNAIHSIGDYIFLDISFLNSSNLSFTVDELRFSIDDRKITKATNVQSVEIKPLWQLYPFEEFRKKHRNIFVIRKATFPGNKVLIVNLTEKQISGRTVNLRIKYRDLLDADSI